MAIANPARKWPTWAPNSAAEAASSVWLVLRNSWIRGPQPLRVNQLSGIGSGLFRRYSVSWFKPDVTLLDRVVAWEAIWVPIRVKAPAIKAIPPSTVIAVAAPRGSPHLRNLLLTGDSSAASRMATATGTKTCDR